MGFLNLEEVLSSATTNLVSTAWFKVLGFLGVWTAIWLPIALLISKLINWQPKEPLTPKQKLILLASLYILAPGIILWKVKADSLTWAELGYSLTFSSLWYTLLGLGVSLVSLSLVFCLESLGNLITWRWQNFSKIPRLLLPILSLSLLVSLVEESIFRGYILITLLLEHSFWLAAIASSIIFAALHLVWERKKTLPQLPGLCLMGIVLVAARVLTNDTIYFALGLHAGWICSLTCIDSAELLIYKHQNHWFTGIEQQPLAGMAGILCLIVTGLGIVIFRYQFGKYLIF